MAPRVVPDHLRPASPPRVVVPGLVRGYVTKVYTRADVADFPSQDPYTGWLCDVHVIEPGYRGVLHNVPVLAASSGVWDAQHRRPRAATIKVDGVVNDVEGAQATALHDRDGDLAIVAFLGGALRGPVIIGFLPHPKSLHVVSSDARLDEWCAGVHFTIDDEGTTTIDLSDASKPGPQPDGSETGGTKKLIVKSGTGTFTFEDGGKATIAHEGGKTLTYDAGKLSVDGGGLVQPVLLDPLRTDLSSLITEWFPVIQAIGGMLGIALPNSPGVIAGLASGTGPSGAYKATNTESD